ncbi:PepSY domain-containing protein [Salinicoccus roseus]|uniref:PepSY domain-containing protein n=1 Tax=Salinicoccus roseus TaxID=45670 RepID=UPI001CA70329|nr:PepSY domain-containing protein [Salinicoccus roseus]MBY8910353.1 PepSY domain-containing protein [Salinicoccus roseus]
MMIKKNHLLIGSIASALVLGACSSANAETDMNWEDDRTEGTTAEAEGNVKKSAQEAVEAAQKNFDGKVQGVELEADDGIYYYEIELENGNEEYEVDIDANNLTVLEESFDREDDGDNDDRDDDSGDNDREDDDRGEGTSSESGKGQPKQSAGNGLISSTEALKIAQNEAGGEVTEWDFDEDDKEYEVEMEAEGKEYEVEVDARTGKVTEIDD